MVFNGEQEKESIICVRMVKKGPPSRSLFVIKPCDAWQTLIFVVDFSIPTSDSKISYLHRVTNKYSSHIHLYNTSNYKLSHYLNIRITLRVCSIMYILPSII